MTPRDIPPRAPSRTVPDLLTISRDAERNTTVKIRDHQGKDSEITFFQPHYLMFTDALEEHPARLALEIIGGHRSAPTGQAFTFRIIEGSGAHEQLRAIMGRPL